MESLSWDIHAEVNKGNWKPVKVSRGGTRVSHLFFADDLMLFGEATEAQMHIMMDYLNRFSERSGL